MKELSCELGLHSLTTDKVCLLKESGFPDVLGKVMKGKHGLIGGDHKQPDDLVWSN